MFQLEIWQEGTQISENLVSPRPEYASGTADFKTDDAIAVTSSFSGLGLLFLGLFRRNLCLKKK